MNSTELGVYILGATALFILAALGLVIPGAERAALCAALSAGAAYVGQFGAAYIDIQQSYGLPKSKLMALVNTAGVVVACAFWVFGAGVVMGAI